MPHIEHHLRPRFSAFVKIFEEGNGDYAGTNRDRIRAQTYRLVARPFAFGHEDVNLLILMKRIGFTHVPLGRSFDHLVRGPDAKSDFIVQGAFAYMSRARKWTKKRTAPPREGWNDGLLNAADSLSEWFMPS
ncbi:hypothetical protein FA13DRAFT_1325593 [Coprinellus micaceus]|uniref:Uncharacterized protein n=1 Tax=Coprinellus micaceus TaxID=71717 RepID=A0A4Y7SR41_COPMI|nr:hypothetical protein FA13DRAFT_1325593 [Coprinellus micaceus]